MTCHISVEELRRVLYDLATKNGGPFQDLLFQLDRDVQDDTSCLNPTPVSPYQIVDWRTVQLCPGAVRTVEEIAQEIARESITPSYQGSNLNNNVHPLLTKYNWFETSDEDYEIALPVLQLASKFLSTPTCWEFYEHVATAELKTRTKRTESGDEVWEAYLARPEIEPTADVKRAAVQRIFSMMIGKVKLRFDKAFPAPGAITYSGKFQCPYIHLSYRIYLLLKHDKGDTSLAALTRRLRYTFTLLHEIAHAFTFGAHWAFMKQNNGAEPRYAIDEPWRESGYSWERATLGWPSTGIAISEEMMEDVEHHRWKKSATLVELSYAHLDRACRGLSPEFNTIVENLSRRFLSSAFVLSMFHRSTWERIASEGLGFIREEANALRFEILLNKPAANWTTVRFHHPDEAKMSVLCFRGSSGDDTLAGWGVLFRLARPKTTATQQEPEVVYRY